VSTEPPLSSAEVALLPGHTNGDIPFTTLDDIEGELKERKDGVNVVVTSGALLMTTLVSAAVTQYLGLVRASPA
jgi:hypothetical protein